MEGVEIVLYTSGIMNIGATNKAISANSFIPIAAAVVSAQDEENGFGTALMLSVAFCATIGGMGSLIGTPPNAIFAAYVGTTHEVAISRHGYQRFHQNY